MSEEMYPKESWDRYIANCVNPERERRGLSPLTPEQSEEFRSTLNNIFRRSREEINRRPR